MTRHTKIYLSFLLIIGILVKITLTIPAAVTQRGRSISECLESDEPKNAKLCESYLPLAKSAAIMAFMNMELDPCDDFYEFACGNWATVNKARPGKLTTGFFEDLSHGLSLKIENVLENTNTANETENDKKLKRFYSSCIKLQNIPLVEHLPSLKNIIKEFGSMPVLTGRNWNADGFDWLETIAKIQHKYGFQSILGASIMADFKDNSRNRIYFGQTELPLQTKSMYVKPETASYRQRYMKKIELQLRKYLRVEEAKANEVAKNIIEFEQMLAEGMLDDGIARTLDEVAKLITPQEMSTKYAPVLNVSRYLELAFGEPMNDSIYDCNEEFQFHLKEKINTVPKETVANYIFYQLVSEFFPKISTDEKQHQKTCAEVVKSHFGKLLDNMIYRRYKQDGTESDINAVWIKIKEAFARELNSDKLSWISPPIKEQARKKLNAMKLEINSYMDTNFTAEMENLVIKNIDFIENVRNINENDVKRMIKKLHEPPTPFEADEELSYTPVNIILENKVKIPVSLLQPFYLWNKAYPEALMYGTLGFLIGHELVHGFDDSGRDYDETGNQRNWWDEKSTEAFDNRTECFIEQYQKYVFGNSQLPRSESQAENIADNGGLRIAYDAYLNWLQTHEDAKLPHLEKYTSKQLFFISYAQVWCSDTEPSLRLLQTSTDEHTPAKFRVIGVLSNYEEFAKEFNCASKTKMNPENKCIIY